ncbi:hypothetical protein Zm00014a_039209, partial [Zea mays]
HRTSSSLLILLSTIRFLKLPYYKEYSL